MKNFILCALLVATSSACVTQRVRDNTLLPAIQQAWPGVRADVEYAGSMTDSELASWDAAVQTGNFLALDTQDLLMQAQAGVDLRLADGQIGPQGAVIMKERAADFVAAVNEYMRSNVAMVRRQPGPVAVDRPLVITRSSWATNPPPTLVPAIRGY